MSKNILYISYDGMTDPLGQSQVIPYLAGLTKEGYSFTILSCEKPERYTVHKDAIGAVLAAVSISWQPILYTKKPPVLSTIYDYYKLKRKAQQLNKQLHFDLVHCRSYISSLLGLWMKRKYHIPFIFDMRGFWADERVDGGLWNLKNPVFKTVYNFFKNKEADFLNESAAIVSLTEAGKTEMLGWASYSGLVPISVIPCAANFDKFTLVNKEGKQAARVELGYTEDEFVVSYLGSLGTWYLLDEMLDFFCVVKKTYPLARFLFLTSELAEMIIDKAEKRGIAQTDLKITFVKPADVAYLIKASDISLCFIKQSYSKISSSPTKLGELLAMGIPAICNKIADVETIINITRGGIVIESCSEKNYHEAVDKLNDVISRPSADIRDRAYKYYDLQEATAKYLKIYNSVFYPVNPNKHL
jgi:glycosyltransferase involved in cell wall biosynthesis